MAYNLKLSYHYVNIASHESLGTRLLYFCSYLMTLKTDYIHVKQEIICPSHPARTAQITGSRDSYNSVKICP